MRLEAREAISPVISMIDGPLSSQGGRPISPQLNFQVGPNGEISVHSACDDVAVAVAAVGRPWPMASEIREVLSPASVMTDPLNPRGGGPLSPQLTVRFSVPSAHDDVAEVAVVAVGTYEEDDDDASEASLVVLMRYIGCCSPVAYGEGNGTMPSRFQWLDDDRSGKELVFDSFDVDNSLLSDEEYDDDDTYASDQQDMLRNTWAMSEEGVEMGLEDFVLASPPRSPKPVTSPMSLTLPMWPKSFTSMSPSEKAMEIKLMNMMKKKKAEKKKKVKGSKKKPNLTVDTEDSSVNPNSRKKGRSKKDKSLLLDKSLDKEAVVLSDIVLSDEELRAFLSDDDPAVVHKKSFSKKDGDKAKAKKTNEKDPAAKKSDKKKSGLKKKSRNKDTNDEADQVEDKENFVKPTASDKDAKKAASKSPPSSATLKRQRKEGMSGTPRSSAGTRRSSSYNKAATAEKKAMADKKAAIDNDKVSSSTKSDKKTASDATTSTTKSEKKSPGSTKKKKKAVSSSSSSPGMKEKKKVASPSSEDQERVADLLLNVKKANDAPDKKTKDASNETSSEKKTIPSLEKKVASDTKSKSAKKTTSASSTDSSKKKKKVLAVAVHPQDQAAAVDDKDRPTSTRTPSSSSSERKVMGNITAKTVLNPENGSSSYNGSSSSGDSSSSAVSFIAALKVQQGSSSKLLLSSLMDQMKLSGNDATVNTSATSILSSASTSSMTGPKKSILEQLGEIRAKQREFELRQKAKQQKAK